MKSSTGRFWKIPFRLYCRSLAPVLFVIIQMLGCRAQKEQATLPIVTSSIEDSVKPGINEPYKNANVDEWLGKFEGESREIFQLREPIAQAVNLKPGMYVADIGAGTGLFTGTFSQLVGPSGKVYAVDIVPEFIEHIQRRAIESGLKNVTTVLCREDSVMLAGQSIDVAFVCDTYHHFEYPKSTLRSIHEALRTGGELVVVDFDRIEEVSRDWVLGHVRAGRDKVISEIAAAGFEWLPSETQVLGLKENYFLRFRKKSEPRP